MTLIRSQEELFLLTDKLTIPSVGYIYYRIIITV